MSVIIRNPLCSWPGNISEVSNLTSFQTALGASLRSINGPSGVWSHRVCSVLCHGSSKESLLGNKIWFWTLFSTTQRLHKPLNHIIGPLKTPGWEQRLLGRKATYYHYNLLWDTGTLPEPQWLPLWTTDDISCFVSAWNVKSPYFNLLLQKLTCSVISSHGIGSRFLDPRNTNKSQVLSIN